MLERHGVNDMSFMADLKPDTSITINLDEETITCICKIIGISRANISCTAAQAFTKVIVLAALKHIETEKECISSMSLTPAMKAEAQLIAIEIVKNMKEESK